MSEPTSIPPLEFGFVEDRTVDAASLARLLESSGFAHILDLLPAAVVIVAGDGRITGFNARAESLLGVRRHTAISRSFLLLCRDTLAEGDEVLMMDEAHRPHFSVRARTGGRYGVQRHQLPGKTALDGFTLFFLSPEYARETAARPRGEQLTRDAMVLTPALERLTAKAAEALGRKVGVLLEGETGVGKSVLARQIHARSARSEGPFVHVNCGSIPEALFESELFGYERGAFTGALPGGRRGYIERAAGGTLFLDEIAEIPLTAQAKLLHFLDDGSVQLIGGGSGRQVDVSVICATHRDLAGMRMARGFRDDLYYRVSSFSLSLPPLRENNLEHWLDTLLEKVNVNRVPQLCLAPDTRRILLSHDFPGNLRELRNVLEHASIMADTVAHPIDLPAYLQLKGVPGPAQAKDGSTSLRDRVRQMERTVIADAIARWGSKREAARQLGIDVATLIRKSRADIDSA
jgi:transcriptional regulator with PAS, ATPase and Fis domain